MADRYRRIYSLEKPLYQKDAPLLIAAGALLEDGGNARLLCQLRFQNLNKRVITSVTVAVTMLDGDGVALEPEIIYTYAALRAEPDTEFGKSTAIVLPDSRAQAFRARVQEVIFAGGIPWRAAPGAWQAIPAHETLAEHYGDEELVTQFRVSYGQDCTHAYAEGCGLWYCICGSVNRTEEANCPKCHRTRRAQAAIDDKVLRTACAKRLKTEQTRREADAAEAAQRRKKHILLAAILVPVLVLLVAAAVILPRNYLRRQSYAAASTMLELGQYDRAAEAFRALGDYADSSEQAEQNVPYQRALYIKSRAELDDAASLLLIGRSRTELNEDVTAAMLLYEYAAGEFHALGDYKDSAEQERLCLAGMEDSLIALRQSAYDAALALLDARHYSAAREAFLGLGNFSDSAAMAKEAVFRKARALEGVVRRYDTSNIYASLSMSSGGTSRFSIPKAIALYLGSQCVGDLREACGEDLVDVTLSDAPAADMIPLADAVEELFAMLEDYRESAEPEPEEPEAEATPAPEAVPEPVVEESPADPLADYYMLCETGDIFGAYDWLEAYTGDFEEREATLEMLGDYMAYCSDWGLYSGDSTLVSYSMGRQDTCNSCSSRVILEGDIAILRITVHGSEESILDLYGSPGDTRFYKSGDNVTYVATVNNADHLSYMRYNANGRLTSSCEYEHDW